MSLDLFIKESVELGVPAISFGIKYFEIERYLRISTSEQPESWYHQQALTRTRTYFKAYTNGLKEAKTK